MHFWLLCSSRAMKNWSYLTLILQKCFFHMELALIVGVFYQNWRILPCNIKHLKVTIVVSWRYIKKKPQLSWIEAVHHAMHFQLLPWQMLAPSSQASKEIVFGLEPTFCCGQGLILMICSVLLFLIASSEVPQQRELLCC